MKTDRAGERVYLQHHHSGVQIPVDPQMLGVSNSLIYQLTDYIGYDILLQYIQELIQQAGR